MRRLEAILAVVLATSLAGCVVNGKPKAAPTPAAPQPVSSAPAPAPKVAEQLSIPQTQVQLPPPQPVNPDALTAAPATEPPAETTPTSPSRPGRGSRPPAPVATPPKPVETPAPAPAPAAPPVEARPPIQEVVPAGEQKRLQESAQARKKEVLQWLDTPGNRRRIGRHQQTAMRIRAFVKDSDEAEHRGDMRQADALAERAQILLRELQNAQ